MSTTIEDLRRIQESLDLQDVHVLWFYSGGFVCAHTDDERHDLSDLTQCELHQYIESLDEMPVEKDGFYVATPHDPDAYSEPYLAPPWGFEPLDV